MNLGDFYIEKRDGSLQPFNDEKIKIAISKAYSATGKQITANELNNIITNIKEHLCNDSNNKTAVEEVQDLVEKELMKLDGDVAKRYIIYREWRTVEREKRTELKHTMDGIVRIEKNDINLSNANMSSHTPAGQMMTFATEVTKDYALKYLLSPQYRMAHTSGDIHIHDLDYYPTKTSTCVQYDLEDLFNRGLKTKNGSIRTPQSIQSYATLATIVFQTNQNEQHGGQAIPAFDFFMAPGVRKTYNKVLTTHCIFTLEMSDMMTDDIKGNIKGLIANANIPLKKTQEASDKLSDILNNIGVSLSKDIVDKIILKSYQEVENATHQAMEGFIHNLNTMHSRGGNQVVFSSVNYGTDTSDEGRMVIRELLNCTMEGLGNGETPIFPIQIFKVKDGVNYSVEDYNLAQQDIEKALNGEISFSTPNFDLLLQSCVTSAHALFPNFVFLDTEFNKHEDWDANDPKRYLKEIATMGCRTRVFENVRGEKTSVGRGNLSFTTINMPRLAIEARIEAENLMPDADKHSIEDKAIEIFYTKVRKMSELVAEQLYERYMYQRTALARQFPFLMSNNVWKGGCSLNPNDEVGDVYSSGTLGIGFIGGHNAMFALMKEGHDTSEKAWRTLYHSLEIMNEVAQQYKEKYNLNYSVLATPAEGLSGRFTRIDKKKYGNIFGVTDKEYYVNSFHIDVKSNVGIFEKIQKEAPFHNLTRGGHITYIELDGEAKKNPAVMLKIVKAMHDTGIGYGSINHPIDTCQQCGYKGVIEHSCPICDSSLISRLRRITGYLTGTLDNWNSSKKAEERDRVKHH